MKSQDFTQSLVPYNWFIFYKENKKLDMQIRQILQGIQIRETNVFVSMNYIIVWWECLHKENLRKKPPKPLWMRLQSLGSNFKKQKSFSYNNQNIYCGFNL